MPGPTNGSHRAPKPRDAHKLAHILRCAAREFYDKGYEGASLRDLSRSSGVSLSGLYYYFQCKQQLLYLIQRHTFTQVVEQLEAQLAGVSDPVERLRVLVRNHLTYFLAHPIEMKVLSHEDEALEGAYRREVAAIKRRYYDLARRIFDHLQQAGGARRLNPRVAVLTLFGMMNWVYTWHKPRVDPQAEALAESIAGIFLDGVRNGHGKAARAGRRAPGNGFAPRRVVIRGLRVPAGALRARG